MTTEHAKAHAAASGKPCFTYEIGPHGTHGPLVRLAVIEPSDPRLIRYDEAEMTSDEPRKPEWAASVKALPFVSPDSLFWREASCDEEDLLHGWDMFFQLDQLFGTGDFAAQYQRSALES